MHVGESASDAVVIEREARVVDPQQVQNSGMEVMSADGVFSHFPANVVGLAVGQAVLEPAPGEPDAEYIGIVVPSRPGLVSSALGIRRAAELGVKNDQGVVEQ